MIEDIRRNIDTEIGMLREIAIYSRRLEYADAVERRLLIETINALREAMRIINNAIPELLNEISLNKRLPLKAEQKKQELAKISYRLGKTEFKATIPRKDRNKLLRELDISESYIKKLGKKEIRFEEEKIEFKASRGYLKLANKLFLDRAAYWINKGYFKKLSKELQRANIDVLFQGYVAMMFMTAFLSFFAGIFISIVLFFVLSITLMVKIAIGVLTPIILPPVIFAFLYYYPTTEKKTIEKKINGELPFAVIHMSAISGSGIQPSEIFRIIGLSREYPYLKREIRKVLNQINLYGYDLVTALNNSSSATPSVKLAELFAGLSTTITSGGDLSEFFEKRSETLLAEYRLTREKYIKTAETFMDIYISVVIAAPMILMLLFVMLSIGDFGLGLGLTIGQLTFFVIAILTLVNTVFLTFLHLNQPTY